MSAEENLAIYNSVRVVPDSAKRAIGAGRLKGKTDINPMWRIKTLTEQFGSCGFGWKYVITEKRMEPGANGEIAAFVDIDLYVKYKGEWSEPIPGTGGSSFVSKEKNGAYTSDECFKMALTDAISVACKALGVGADVYWDKDVTKYDKQTGGEEKPPDLVICDRCGLYLETYKDKNGRTVSIRKHVEGSLKQFGQVLCIDCVQKALESAPAS